MVKRALYLIQSSEYLHLSIDPSYIPASLWGEKFTHLQHNFQFFCILLPDKISPHISGHFEGRIGYGKIAQTFRELSGFRVLVVCVFFFVDSKIGIAILPNGTEIFSKKITAP